MVVQIISSTEKKVVLQVEIELSSSMLESESKIQAALNETGSLATKDLLERFDTNGKAIKLGSVTMTSKGQIESAYQTPYGEVNIARHVYQTSKGGKTFCPLEQNGRIILSATPMFAKQLSSKYSEIGARRVVNDLLSNHGRKITHTFVQDVVDAVAAVSLAHEESWSYEIPKQTQAVKAVSIGIDGTCMLTVTDGWRQAMVGTIALYSKSGERLHTTYIGATPEHGKETFIERMELEIKRANKLFPNATYVGVADGAKENWPFLKKHTDSQCLDFYHASEYLTKAADSVFFKDKEKRDEWLESACHRLKHNHTGPAALLREMQGFRSRHLGEDRRETLENTITYFKNQKKHMNYAEHVENNLPIGSGVTEAACKVIVKQRLCGSGMRWKEEGAAAVLSLRCLNYTPGRWEQFWQKIDINGFAMAA
jgi:hypothetical protein